MAKLTWVMGALCVLALGCGSAESKKSPIEDPGGNDDPGDDGGGGIEVEPPIVNGDFTFYGSAQGLTAGIRDVSAEEGGNVYVAGSEALFVKKAGPTAFVRVDSEKAGPRRTAGRRARSRTRPRPAPRLPVRSSPQSPPAPGQPPA